MVLSEGLGVWQGLRSPDGPLTVAEETNHVNCFLGVTPITLSTRSGSADSSWTPSLVRMTNDTVARRSYPKGIKRRELIVKTALEVFSERGYTSTSMREIAARAGLAQSGLLHHFSGKSDLLTAVLDLRDSLGQQAIERSQPQTLFDYVAVVLAHNAENRGLTTLFTVLSAEAINENHDAHAYFVKRYASNHAAMLNRLRVEQRAGRIRTDIDTETAAASIIALSDGLQLQREFRPVDPVATLRRLWTDYLEPQITEDIAWASDGDRQSAQPPRGPAM
jgi:AcrR family transcriptional regulator